MSEKKFTKGMVIIVGGFGLLSTLLLLNDPPAAGELDATPAIFETNSLKISQFAQREVASAHEESAQPSVLQLSCLDENQVFDTTSVRLRLKGEGCLTEKSTSTKVKNLSNGFIATVFHKPDFSFTTDYINLSEGKNEIDLSFETPNGVTTKKLTVNRTLAGFKK